MRAGNGVEKLMESFKFSSEAILNISFQNEEPSWLKDNRLIMFDVYNKKEFPLRKDEEGRKSDLLLFDLCKFDLIISKCQPQNFSDEPIDKSKYEAIIEEINFSVIYKKISDEAKKKGVIFCNLSEAVKKYPELVKNYYNEKYDAEQLNKLEAMGNAFWTSGIFLFIPDNVQLKMPVRYLSILDEGDCAFVKKNIIIVGQGGQLYFYDESFSPETSKNVFVVNNTTIYCEKDAEVYYVYLQNLSNNHYVFSFDKALLKQGSKLNWLSYDCGGKFVKVNRKADIIGVEGVCKMFGGFFVQGSQHIDIWTHLEHIAERTKGEILYKGVLTDTARSAFRGSIKINKESKQTESFLRNYNVKLSCDARAKSIPILEILTNDVNCKHAASMDEIDENQLFYLMSRGLSEDNAKKIIIKGFFEDLISKANSKLVESKVRKNIEEKIRFL